MKLSRNRGSRLSTLTFTPDPYKDASFKAFEYNDRLVFAASKHRDVLGAEREEIEEARESPRRKKV